MIRTVGNRRVWLAADERFHWWYWWLVPCFCSCSFLVRLVCNSLDHWSSWPLAHETLIAWWRSSFCPVIVLEIHNRMATVVLYCLITLAHSYVPGHLRAPKRHLGDPKMHLWVLKRHPRCLKRHPRCLKRPLRQMPEEASQRPQEASYRPEEASQRPEEAFQWPGKACQRTEEASQRHLRGLKRYLRGLKRHLLIFGDFEIYFS